MSKQPKVFLKPTEKALLKTTQLYNAIDALVANNCFQQNNTMRPDSDSILFWEWALLEVNGHKIPVPYHTCSDTESVLYDYKGDEVIMSNEECVYTNAVFFLTHLKGIVDYMKNNDKINTMYAIMLTGGVDFFNKINDEQFHNIIHKLKCNISEKGFKVLD